MVSNARGFTCVQLRVFHSAQFHGILYASEASAEISAISLHGVLIVNPLETLIASPSSFKTFNAHSIQEKLRMKMRRRFRKL